jgi:sulfatase modifying factor 1
MMKLGSWIGVVAGGVIGGAMLTAPRTAAGANPVGVVDQKPAAEPAVEIDGKFMVPYVETIPGTKVEFEMIPIPGGEFLLGSPQDEADRGDDEGPQVLVRVAPFWIGKHEVTWAEYQAYMKMYNAFKQLQTLAANRAATAADEDGEGWELVETHAWNGDVDDPGVDGVTSPTPLYMPDHTYMAGDQPNQPAVTMTHYAARQFTKWLSGLTGQEYRLPSEAEWEYAARAGTTTPYSFGDDAGKAENYAWLDDNADYETHPVGAKQPNAWGLFDMHGNVAEWTLDAYAEDAYEKLGEQAKEGRGDRRLGGGELADGALPAGDPRRLVARRGGTAAERGAAQVGGSRLENVGPESAAKPLVVY